MDIGLHRFHRLMDLLHRHLWIPVWRRLGLASSSYLRMDNNDAYLVTMAGFSARWLGPCCSYVPVGRA